MWTFMKENKSEWGKHGPEIMGRGQRTFGQWTQGLLRQTFDSRDTAEQSWYRELRWDYGADVSTVI